MAKNIETMEIPVHGHNSTEMPGFLTPDVTLLIVTWVCFFLLLAILSKFAWNPILKAIDEREAHIKKSVEDADKIKAQMEILAAKQDEMIREAQQKAKHIIDQSRHAASEAAKHIHEKAREESQIILENAKREIHEEAERVQANLRQESATIAVELASKLIEENLNQERNQKIIDGYIREL